MSRKPAVLVALVATLLVAAFLISILWWRLWMYYGWLGSPGLLHNIIPGIVDGKRSYDITLFEMFGLCFAVLGVGAAAVWARLNGAEKR